MQNKSTEWYVVPGDAKTNEAIAELLSLTCDATGNDVTFEDESAIERKGWRVEYRVISQLEINKRHMGLLFTVYVCEPGRPARQYKLHEKKKKSAKVKKVEADLRRITKKK